MYIYIYYLGTWTLRIDHARAVHVRYIPLVCNMPATSNPGLTHLVCACARVCVCAHVCVCVWFYVCLPVQADLIWDHAASIVA